MTRSTLLLAFTLAACSQGSTPEAAPAAASTGSESPATDAPTADTTAVLQAALAGPQRSEENRARDAHRHPLETLQFLGLQPGMQVVELSPGGGWYTEVLAPVVCQGGGKLQAVIPTLDGRGAKYAQAFLDRVAKDPEVFSCVEAVHYDPAQGGDLGAEGSADMVLTFRNTHGWINQGQVDAVYAAAFRVLKPGGIFGVVQHRADDGADPLVSSKNGYVPEAYSVELAQKAGFVLVASSDINRNPRDDHDHPEGVWTLPPNLRLGETDRDTYLAIGESDRMTLKFQKPATPTN